MRNGYKTLAFALTKALFLLSHLSLKPIVVCWVKMDPLGSMDENQFL